MAKLYFKYGAMGSSKTATALITKYNYEERGMKVWLCLLYTSRLARKAYSCRHVPRLLELAEEQPQRLRRLMACG